LPHLIVERKRAGLDTLVDILNVSLSDICVQHAFEIAKHLLAQDTDEKYARAVEFFEVITDSYIGIQELIELCEVRLVQYLALELSASIQGNRVRTVINPLHKNAHYSQ